MSQPERSAAIAKALGTQAVHLPEDFAAQVAALAEARARGKGVEWSAVVLSGAFFAMLWLCVAAGSRWAPQAWINAEWATGLARVLASQPWLFVGVAGLVVIQTLSFGRRARI